MAACFSSKSENNLGRRSQVCRVMACNFEPKKVFETQVPEIPTFRIKRCPFNWILPKLDFLYPPFSVTIEMGLFPSNNVGFSHLYPPFSFFKAFETRLPPDRWGQLTVRSFDSVVWPCANRNGRAHACAPLNFSENIFFQLLLVFAQKVEKSQNFEFLKFFEKNR